MGPRNLVAAVLCCLASSLAAQQSAAPTPPGITAPAHTSAETHGSLTLSVVVSARDGKPVPGLQQQDFSVQLDKKPLPVLAFQAVQSTATTTPPIDTILLIDAVNTRFSRVAYERNEIERYLRRNGGKLAQPTTLAVLTDDGVRITPESTQDGNALADFLDKVETGLRIVRRSQGFNGWFEQFQISTRALKQLTTYESSRPGRKLLVWVSPGWPLLSGPEVDLSSKDRRIFFSQLVDISNSLREARITLTSVDPIGVGDAISYQTEFYKMFLKGVRTPDKMDIGDLSLQVIALQSGGQVLNSNNDVTSLITTATADAETFYTITIPTPPVEHPDEYHDISVSLDKPGLKARTATGFYDEP
jgi:VWFA-related protein